MNPDLTKRTISDFGDQWTRYTDNEGYYGSSALLADILEPLVSPADLQDVEVTEIGSGTGRIVNMLLDVGARHVVAIEPSAAISALRVNTESRRDRVTYLNCRGDELPPNPPQDFVLSIGVLHHIPRPEPVLRAAWEALRPGGQMLVWLYGREGNGAYLAFARPLRALTRRLPHWALAALCHTLNVLLSGYIWVARRMPLPMHRYATGVIGKFSRQKRYLVIYDQLNPSYARYYRRSEACELLSQAGFVDVRAHHRHGYSWTVVGRRPQGQPPR